MLTAAVRSPGGSRYSQARHGMADLPAFRMPTPFNGQFRLPAGVSLLRPRFAPATGCGMFTALPSGPPFGFPLGPG